MSASVGQKNLVPVLCIKLTERKFSSRLSITQIFNSWCPQFRLFLLSLAALFRSRSFSLSTFNKFGSESFSSFFTLLLALFLSLSFHKCSSQAPGSDFFFPRHLAIRFWLIGAII
ncbi:hypothetical protein J6590_074957 [Homalodisca vitripennis]|nr:hypothetical protein J6590_074957 [Homalodisca vitripennis]